MPNQIAVVRRWLFRAGPWVLAAALAWLVFSTLNGQTLLRTGSTVPELVGRRPDGSSFRLSGERGKVVVLNFWATWCPPCRKEAPDLTRAYHRLARRHDLVVGVSVDGPPLGSVMQMAPKLGIDYPIVTTGEKYLRRFRIQRLPTTYIIAPNGTIVRSVVGAIDPDDLKDAVAEARRHSG